MSKILVIDDKQDNLTAITALLKNLMPECAMFTALSGPDGIAKALQELPDTILLDINMPVVDGFETCRRLKADERTRPIPVIMVTAVRADTPSRIKGLELGADAFLSKPIDESELISQIRVALRIKAAEDALRRERDSLEALVQERTDELRKSEERFRIAQDMSPDGFTILRPVRDAEDRVVDFTWVYENPAIARLNGSDRAEGVGQHLLELFPGPRGMPLLQACLQVSEFGAPLTMEAGYSGKSMVKPTWFRIVVVPMGGDIAILTQDITERKEHQEILEEANHQLLLSQENTLRILEDLKAENQVRRAKEKELQRVTTAIEQVAEVVIITDATGTIEYVNPAFATVTGYTANEALGQTPRILKSDMQDQAFYRDLWETITAGRIWQGRMVNKNKDGGFYNEESTISPVVDETGRIIHYVAVKRDISEHMALTAQLIQAQKMESVGRLAGGVAHDFNNMLSVILGHAEMGMMRLPPEHPVSADLTQISMAAKRSADLTRQLLAFARKQTIAPKVLDLNETVSELLKMLQRLIGENIHLHWQPAVNLWPVKMDPTQIDQILANLCVNARDAIHDLGTITIETACSLINKDYCAQNAGFVVGEYVKLTISDNGCGMNMETQAKIFEPFFTTKSLGEGTGLGLATVYGIVKQNNGFINVSSELGLGTTFTLYLPRYLGPGEPKRTEVTAKSAKRGDEVILLVEDEPTILDIVSLILKEQGYTLLAAKTPNEAMQLASQHAGPIHLLITDVILPEMNGKDLAEKLQTLYPQLKCLYMSGYTADIIAQHGVLNEGVHFIQKPFSLSDMAAKVRDALDD